ncbi:hypothetical protein LTT66_31905 [Nocardia gipuzkoensis]|uniref:hypothetical protein n=1 Tax=Nocardia gipuzkoensis TaxID=2749991 RepID=UPI001E3CF6FC|nr:hypothetical protein [Nocardia gipuzkoensis]UGT67750.1 hypothetical protein LTT66_31905 [Nocardia gipuzkoensis]
MLSVLLFVLFSLNHRLDNQYSANRQTLHNSVTVVQVNDRLTSQLKQLTDITAAAKGALQATAALTPVLDELEAAIKPAADLLSSAASNTQLSNEQLTSISSVLVQVRDTVVPLAAATQHFGDLGKQLLNTVQTLVSDLENAVTSARTINQMLPLPG